MISIKEIQKEDNVCIFTRNLQYYFGKVKDINNGSITIYDGLKFRIICNCNIITIDRLK